MHLFVSQTFKFKNNLENITIEFYKRFWENFKIEFLEVYASYCNFENANLIVIRFMPCWGFLWLWFCADLVE